MNKVDFLIVGGSAAGTTAAEQIRNLKPDASISIVSEEPHTQYSRILVPHFIRGKVGRDQVYLKHEDWYLQKKIELIKGVACQKIEAKDKIVSLSNGAQIQFGKLLVATGGKVIPFAVPGADSKNLVYLRTIEDADKIITLAKQSKKALVIGGGFIGLEMVSCFLKNGVSDITALVLEDYYWQGKLDEISSKLLSEILIKNGIRIETNVVVDHFETVNGEISAVIAKNGRRFEADLVGVGIGIRADLVWLDEAGIKTDRGIVTNECLETNLPDIYAAGDCAQFWDTVFEREHILGNWANATSQGSAVGKTMGGERTVFETASSYSVNFFDPPNSGTCSFLGVTDREFADEVIVRGTLESGKISRLFIKNYNSIARIVGATIVNNAVEVAPLTLAIKGKLDVKDYLADLANVEFDLKSLVA